MAGLKCGHGEIIQTQVSSPQVMIFRTCGKKCDQVIKYRVRKF